MQSIYARLRERARQIVAGLPSPDFYRDHRQACEVSRRFFESDPLIAKLHRHVSDALEDDFGHGLQHAVRVTIDAGALMVIEDPAAGRDQPALKRRLQVVQSAGLLHDIRRKHKDHARLGATYARSVLENYPFSTAEIEDICRAIHNHEAFKAKITCSTSQGLLVSDCLYDADKFRWGPDNFTDTLWDMLSFVNPPLAKFMARYARGMQVLEDIKSTFCTATGKKYGPQFIDIGLAAGRQLYEVIQREYADCL